MKQIPKPARSVRVDDQRTVFKTLFLREAVFRLPITSAAVKSGLRPRTAASPRTKVLFTRPFL